MDTVEGANSIYKSPYSCGLDLQLGILVDPDECKSPVTIRGPRDTMSCELWDSLEESTNKWIWCPERDFLLMMS